MRIDELTKPEDLTDFRDGYNKDTSLFKRESKKHLELLMNLHGFSKIGEGFFAQVYTHPKYKDSVFKIFNEDANMVTWLKECRSKSSSNPYYPRIKSKPIKIVGEMYLVRMEKLSFGPEAWQEKMETFLLTYVRYLKSVITKGVPREKMQSKLEEYESEFEMYYNDPAFVEAMDNIMKITKNEPDIHSGNFMLRGNQMVLTDPVAS